MAVAVFLRIMCAKATATIASYRSTPVPSTQREEFSFLSFFVLWREDNNYVVFVLLLVQLTCKHANAHITPS